MKTERTIILPWLLSASLSLAQTFVPRAGPDPALGQAEYDRFCPSQNGTIQTLSPSSSVVVHCDAIPRLPVLGDREWTASMEDCGLWCENMGTACMASFWDPRDGACYWSGAQAVEPKTKYVSLVQMTSLDSCDKEKEQCFKAKAQCLNDKAACLKAKGECEKREQICLRDKKNVEGREQTCLRDKRNCEGREQTCLRGKRNCDATEASLRRELQARNMEIARFRERTPCNAVHGQGRIVGNRIFKILCNHHHGPYPYRWWPSTNMWECIEACANDNNCVGGNWLAAPAAGFPGNHCYLKSTGGHLGAFNNHANAHSWLKGGVI